MCCSTTRFAPTRCKRARVGASAWLLTSWRAAYGDERVACRVRCESRVLCVRLTCLWRWACCRVES
eukprot:900495-Rhodomonas_salina.1